MFKIFNKAEKPIYHYHIRKTAGTSLNISILNSITGNGDLVYSKLAKSRKHKVKFNNKLFVGWDSKQLKKANYDYGFSHIPFHDLLLPNHVYKFTCVRDPVDRVLSHYNMLIEYRDNKINHPCMKQEGKYIEKDFHNFLKILPEEKLLNQLFMFSKNLNPNEALQNINTMDLVINLKDLSRGLEKLSDKIGNNVEAIHKRKAIRRYKPSDSEMDNLRTMLEKEYRFLDQVLAMQ